MRIRLPEGCRVAEWRGIAERVVVVVCGLATCHVVWTMLMASGMWDERNLPWFHAAFADWVIRPRLLLILAAAFAAGFASVPFAKGGRGVRLAMLKVLSTVAVVLALCTTAIAFAALLFPIRSMPPVFD